MVEYGNGVGDVGGQVSGGHGGGSIDAGAAIGQFIAGAAHTVSTMSPTQLILLAVVFVIGLVILRRAF